MQLPSSNSQADNKVLSVVVVCLSVRNEDTGRLSHSFFVLGSCPKWNNNNSCRNVQYLVPGALVPGTGTGGMHNFM